MNQQQQQMQQPDSMGALKQGVGAFAFVAQTFTVSVHTFLHKGFGERFFGVQAACVIPLVLLFSTLDKRQDPIGLIWFLVFYVLMCLVGKADIAHRLRRGGVEHSRSPGHPRILDWRMFRRLSERSARLFVEPLIVFLTAVCILPHSQPLGAYLLLATLGMFGAAALEVGYRHSRLVEMRDAYIEQKDLAERFRRGFE